MPTSGFHDVWKGTYIMLQQWIFGCIDGPAAEQAVLYSEDFRGFTLFGLGTNHSYTPSVFNLTYKL
jgi:hypothetical protein